jgi:DnaJ-class molecular chaperone
VSEGFTDDEHLARWHALLSEANYYQLLGIARSASFDDVQNAFQRFAVDFHPDQHRTRAELERETILAIFRRGSEAYRVLQDGDLRARYDMALSDGHTRLNPSITPGAPRTRTSSVAPDAARATTQRLEDSVRTASIRPFARRAEELAAQGDFAQAHLQVRLALSREPENTVLKEFEQALRDRKKL